MNKIKNKFRRVKFLPIFAALSLLFFACANSSTDTSPSPRWTVTIVANGGRVSATSYTVTDGDSVDIPTPTKTGYAFVGWTVTNGGTSPNFTPDSTKVTANITIYAIWIKSYTVSIRTNGGTPTSITKKVNAGSTLTLSATELPKNSAKYITGIKEYRDGNNDLFVMGKTIVNSDLSLRVRWNVDLLVIKAMLDPLTTSSNAGTKWGAGTSYTTTDVWVRFYYAPDMYSLFYYFNPYKPLNNNYMNNSVYLSENDRTDYDYIAKFNFTGSTGGTFGTYLKSLTDTTFSACEIDGNNQEISVKDFTKI